MEKVPGTVSRDRMEENGTHARVYICGPRQLKNAPVSPRPGTSHRRPQRRDLMHTGSRDALIGGLAGHRIP